MLIIVNLLAMAAVGTFLLWAAMGFLDIWTDHGHEEVVPEVKGLPYDRAVERLLEAGLTVELSDSVYDNKVAPGTVMEQNPKMGTKVKPGRLVYLTVNAFSPKMVTVPSVTDMSVRQARSILEGLGIAKVEEISVVSEYKDLVMGAKYNGRRISPGARVPVNATIVLEVGDGMPDFVDSIPVDTLHNPTPEEELQLF